MVAGKKSYTVPYRTVPYGIEEAIIFYLLKRQSEFTLLLCPKQSAMAKYAQSLRLMRACLPAAGLSLPDNP